MPVTNFFHTFVMSYLLVLNEFIFASLVLTYYNRIYNRLLLNILYVINQKYGLNL